MIQDLYKKKLLQTFKAFISFCNQNELIYYCCGGTALGALRHYGIIPWDDDIDVFMPRADFEKLIKLSKEAEKNGYSVASLKNGTNYNLPLKFYDMNTSLWEISEIPFISGVFIDIFPLDRTKDNEEQFLRKYKQRKRIELLYQLSYSRYSLTSVIDYYRKGNKKYFSKGLFSFFIPSFLSGYFRKKLLAIDKAYMTDDGPNLISPYGDYWIKEYLRTEWFEAGAKVPFEDFEVCIGNGTKEYLTRIYGDYMKLPPREKQISHHYHYYLNLEKKMTREEIIAEIKSKK